MEYKTITLRAWFDLYHLTYRNTKYNRVNLEGEINDEAYDYMCKLPENDYIKDLNHPKYFSINYYHPLYFNAVGDKSNNAHLHYQTLKSLILFDGRNYDKHDILDFLCNLERTKKLNNQFIDGWLIKDDSNDTWHEIYLFCPTNSVDPNCKVITYTKEEIDQFKDIFVFPYGQEELDIIEKFES